MGWHNSGLENLSLLSSILKWVSWPPCQVWGQRIYIAGLILEDVLFFGRSFVCLNFLFVWLLRSPNFNRLAFLPFQEGNCKLEHKAPRNDFFYFPRKFPPRFWETQPYIQDVESWMLSSAPNNTIPKSMKPWGVENSAKMVISVPDWQTAQEGRTLVWF
jgi:hypothetical protein